MVARVITTAQATKNLLEILTKVKYQHQQFIIKKGKEMVANIVPVASSNVLYVTELKDFFEQLPSLSADDSSAFSKDIEDIRVNQSIRNPWE